MGSPTGHYNLYLSQLLGQHYRGAVITNDASLKILPIVGYSFYTSDVRKMHVESLSQGLNVDLA